MYYSLAFSIVLLFSLPFLFPAESRYLLRQVLRSLQNRRQQQDRQYTDLSRVYEHNTMLLARLKELRRDLSDAPSYQQYDLSVRALAAAQRQLLATDPDKFPFLYRTTERVCRDLERDLEGLK